ncbi:hypothetical protein BBJ28_00012430 [Nothophytophthora sp. Chile5]|nr:hypothetical protein BBJ28_00012430 [Nothophytophthora sp. Chile5]
MARIGNNSIDCSSAGSTCKPASLATASSPSSVEDQPSQTAYCDFSVDRSAISPSEAVSLAAEMAADFYSEVSIMYDMLSDINTPSEEGLAVGELMRRMRNLLSDGSHSGGNAVARITNVRGVYNGLIRVYVFLFQRYYRAFVVLDVNELLIACWQRLLAFVVECRILDEMFIHKVSEHVVKIVTAC